MSRVEKKIVGYVQITNNGTLTRPKKVVHNDRTDSKCSSSLGGGFHFSLIRRFEYQRVPGKLQGTVFFRLCIEDAASLFPLKVKTQVMRLYIRHTIKSSQK